MTARWKGAPTCGKPQIDSKQMVLARMRLAGREGDTHKRDSLIIMRHDMVPEPELRAAYAEGQAQAVTEQAAAIERRGAALARDLERRQDRLKAIVGVLGRG